MTAWRTIIAAGAAAMLVGGSTALAADHTIRVGLIAQVGQPIEKGAQLFKKKVEERSKGRASVKVYPGGQLGGEIELQDSVANGTIQMANIGTPVMSGKLKKLDILNMYYLWRDRKHMKEVLEGSIGSSLFSEYETATGIRVISANWQQGTRKTILKQKAVRPTDLNGVKIRVTAGVPIYDELWKAMGASPIPLAFPDAYSAMQTGVVDGVELPPDFIFNNGFHDLGKFLVETDHYFYTNVMIVNKAFHESLPQDLQTIVKEAAIEAGDYQTRILLEQQDQVVAKIRDSGVEVVKADTQAFADAVRPVFKKNMDTWGRDLYDRIVAAGH